jgi:hypothetical protein
MCNPWKNKGVIMSKNIDKRINENTAAIHRKSVSKAFGAKPAPMPVSDKDSNLEADAKTLQELLGKDVNVSPVKKAKGGMISSASKRADGCAIKGKTRGKMV